MSDLQKAFDLQTRIIEELRTELQAANEGIARLNRIVAVAQLLSVSIDTEREMKELGPYPLNEEFKKLLEKETT